MNRIDLLILGCIALCGACGPTGNECGPTRATVARVVDGDTIELDSGERVRYLLVDTPEITTSDCYAAEARLFNQDLVEGKEITLEYDLECQDNFGRLLAYVSVMDREVNTLMIERGYACVLYIAPNGEDRRTEFFSLQAQAESQMLGMWGVCDPVPCL